MVMPGYGIVCPMRNRLCSEMPVYYACQRCTACCRWPGQVKLTDAEIKALAEYRGISEFDFIQAFTRLRPDRTGLALKEKENGACIFLEGQDCAVQAVKPRQCRDFPNRWRFPGFERSCRAVPMEVTEAEYARRCGRPALAHGQQIDGPCVPSASPGEVP
jgi:uncharacterized protein